MFIGVPGSGKTYFATRLTDKLAAVRLNSDGMRLAIFGSLEAVEEVYNSSDRKRVNDYVFGAMDYATEQLLSGGVTVVYEAIQRTYDDRRKMRELADRTGAISVLAWMKVDTETAVQRIQVRAESDEVRRFTQEKAREVVDHFTEQLDIPTPDERLIEIPGDIPFDQQFTVFDEFVKKLR